VIAAIIIIKKSRTKKLKKEVEDLYVRFNAVKTVPLAFKLSKAQAMAKRSAETSASVEKYYTRYEEVEKHINQVQDLLNNVDDSIAESTYKESLESIRIASENLEDCEKEVKDIDTFLEEFSKRENEQREYSSELKEKYRIVKTTINKNSQALSISYDGFLEKLKECEDLFSSSEEYMYASDYLSAQSDLEKIEDILENIKISANAIPKLVKDAKGVLPIMLDETKRELALTKQRGVYTQHLDIDNKINNIEMQLNEDIKNIMAANTEGIKENLSNAKDMLNVLNDELERENRAYKTAKDTNDSAYEHVLDMERVENYVRVAYDKDSARFGLEDLKEFLKQKRENIEKYKSDYSTIASDLAGSLKPSSEILVDAENLAEKVEIDMKSLYSYKTIIDKSTDGENRAMTQLTKLQLVVSEVETKIAEYALPSIDESYKKDLAKSREYIDRIKNEIDQIPINIEELNSLLDESIDFIYKFYNNINNVVGMGIMVENAIVFGNKYRSTYPEIDRELSKAEFQYLNGEYTKALKTAITCIETLFPDDADEKILESVQ
jgi:septation ring formation regulator